MGLRRWLVEMGDADYYKVLENELKEMKSVLDVGCGENSPLARVNKNFNSVGVDIFESSITKSKKAKIHDDYKVGNILKIDTLFKPKSFDVVIALDVVEHFEKKDAIKLLKAMDKVAKKKVVILTPNGFAKQDPYDGNPFQEHKSGWSISDFKNLGYNVFGMRGLRFLRGGEGGASIKFKPWFLWGAISALSQPFCFFIPQIACQLLAVKEKKV
ncbi:MAG: class I SAM-dependent methyltransferase [Candidatus Levybacteria bacterium]|nr:class I SAM-dependent methyltransferase [Candidatus Levybacteria bacterium]